MVMIEHDETRVGDLQQEGTLEEKVTNVTSTIPEP